MATKNRSRDVLVGGFTVLALVVFALAVMAVGGETRLFSKKASYRALLQSSDGLARKQYPAVEIVVTDYVGAHPLMATIVTELVRRSQ